MKDEENKIEYNRCPTKGAYSTRSFCIIFICIALFVFRYFTYPSDDKVLRQLTDDQSKGLPPPVLKLKIVEEPNLKNNLLNLKTRLLSICKNDAINFSEAKDPTELKDEREKVLDCQNISEHKSATFVSIKASSKVQSQILKLVSNDELEIGDEILISGNLRKIYSDQPKPDEASFNQYLLKEKMFYELSGIKVWGAISNYQIFSMASLIRFRKMIENSIADLLPKPTSDLAQGLIVSGKGSMSKELLDEFKKVGLIHIVVLSGSNVSIISSALFALLGGLSQILKVGLGITGMALFACMTGAAPPVVRSVLMSSVPLLIKMFEIKDNNQGEHKGEPGSHWTSVRLLLFSGAIMSIYNPMLPVYDVSFQLSFAATMGLILLTEPMKKLIWFLPDKFGIKEIVASSLGTQFFVLPILLSFSGQVSLIFLIANCLVLPILPLVMLFIFLMSFTSFIASFLAYPFQIVTWTVLSIILKVVHILASLPFSTIEFEVVNIKVKWISLSIVTVCALIIYEYIHKKKRRELIEKH